MIFPFSFLKRVALMSANDVPYIQSSMPRAEMSFIAITFTEKTGITDANNFYSRLQTYMTAVGK